MIIPLEWPRHFNNSFTEALSDPQIGPLTIGPRSGPVIFSGELIWMTAASLLSETVFFPIYSRSFRIISRIINLLGSFNWPLSFKAGMGTHLRLLAINFNNSLITGINLNWIRTRSSTQSNLHIAEIPNKYNIVSDKLPDRDKIINSNIKYFLSTHFTRRFALKWKCFLSPNWSQSMSFM